MEQYRYEDPAQAPEEDWTEEVTADLAEGSGGEEKKSPERIAREKEFTMLYEALMHPEKPLSVFRRQCLLDDLYLLLTKLHRGWVFARCASYKGAGFHDVEPEEALSIGCSYVYAILQADQAQGNYCTYPVGHYLKIAQHKTIDHYFRPRFGRLSPRKADPDEPRDRPLKRREPLLVSLESMYLDDNGIYREDRNRALACDPFDGMGRSRRESDEKNAALTAVFLRELMNYPDEPQKPLALMYGSILFHLARESEEHSRLAMTARKSTKSASPSWAHQAMGKLPLKKLGDVSGRIVRRFYQQPLAWGEAFERHMREDDGTGRSKGDIVYTDTYTLNQTSDWIESLSKSTMQKCARRLSANPELREFAVESLSTHSKLYKAIAKIEKKEACR